MTTESPTLLNLLLNPLLFNLIIPHIPINSVLALSATSHTFHNLLKSSPDTFRYLSLTSTSFANVFISRLDAGGISWRSERMDESLTEEEFRSGPLRGILYHYLPEQNIMRHVSTLIIDYIPATIDILEDIILDTSGRFNVRILSARKSLLFPISEKKELFRILKAALTRSTPPKLKVLYIFGVPEVLEGNNGKPLPGFHKNWVAEAQALLPGTFKSTDPWYLPVPGKTHETFIHDQVYGSLVNEVFTLAEGKIQFDSVLCRAPLHDPELPELAVFPLGFGCMNCGTSPEGPAIYGKSPSTWLPALSPPPITTSASSASKPPRKPDGTFPELYARCETCVWIQRCTKCRRWICETCAEDYLELRKWVSSYAAIEAGLIPKENLRGAVYEMEVFTGTGAQEEGILAHQRRLLARELLCLDRCMREEFEEGYSDRSRSSES